MKIALVFLLSGTLYAQSLGPSYGGGCVGTVCAAAAAVSFSLPAGSYSGAQTTTISGPSGTTCMYTVDGSTPSIASPPATGPIAISASQTIKAICAQIGVAYQNTQACGSGGACKCVTPNGLTYGTLNCQAGGGVGTIDPSNVVWTRGTTASFDISTTSSTGTTQTLFIWTSPVGGCSDCNMFSHEIIFKPDQGSTFLLNNEMDANYNEPAQGNAHHAASLQCNQQSGKLQWQVDDQQGPWYDTSFSFGCPNSLTAKTTARLSMHWVNGDTACSGTTCDHYDLLTVCVEGTGCQDKDLSVVNWGFGPGILPGDVLVRTNTLVTQQQPDLTNTTKSGVNPTTAGRTVYEDNVAVGYTGTSVTGSAVYTIH